MEGVGGQVKVPGTKRGAWEELIPVYLNWKVENSF